MCVSNSMCYPHRGRHHPNTAIGKSDAQVLQEVLPDSTVRNFSKKQKKFVKSKRFFYLCPKLKNNENKKTSF